MDPVTRVQISAPAPLLKTIFYEIISMAKKGSAEERDLVHKLWERDFLLTNNIIQYIILSKI